MSGCQTPIDRINRFATEHSFQREAVEGTMFRHIVMRNRAPLDGVLHVYIEGDGTPFVNASTLAVDPTPRQPVMLELMALDSHRAVYVGRPCYLGLRTDSSCSPVYWSLRRFSPEVVQSLAAVIRAEMQRAGQLQVALYGHSGGGALAVLLTRELPVSELITLGGNLDTGAWTTLHGYTPLEGSLNPIGVTLELPLLKHAAHFVGTNDTDVPAALVRNAAKRIGGAVHEIPGYTHQCCWEQLWSLALIEVEAD